MKKAELIFVPSTGVGHLVSTVEAAKLMLDGHDRLTITILIFKRSHDSKLIDYTDSLTATDRFRFIILPMVESEKFNLDFMDNQKPQVEQAVSKLISTSDSSLAGFVLDMFCTAMIDVAKAFGVPSYIFFTSNAAFLGFTLHVQLLYDEHGVDPSEFKDSGDAELAIPAMAKPLPARVLPVTVLDKDWLPHFLRHARRFREAKGILVNSFMELESHAVNSLGCRKNPPVYPVGPILNLGSNGKEDIMEWLDDQPSSSVVFLCFGSRGSFGEDQVKEIAYALEHSGHRFLWSLRCPPPKDKWMEQYPCDYQNPQDVLPSGFLDRTAGIGKIIGWAPQTTILAHPAIGSFVSHCGWNSTLESIWFGIPIATWPMYAEQQFNAFELVEELEMAVEIKMDYRNDREIIVKAEEIERGIRGVMERDSEIRRKVKEMSEKSKEALMEDGSSSTALNSFIRDAIGNVS